MKKGESFNFQLPAQNLKNLSFCKTETDAVAEWVSSLPVANLGTTTRSLYEAIDEVNRLKIAPQQRLDFLEALRPAIYYACNSLEKHYLNQPVVLPEQPKKIADLAQSLQMRLLRGYIIASVQFREKMHGFSLSKPTQQMAQTVHRAISDATQLLVRSYQLYQSLPDYFWLELHQLNQLTQQYKLERHRINDPQCIKADSDEHADNPVTAYKRALLLSCMKANQLRQEDIKLVAGQILDDWVEMTELTTVDHNCEKRFIVNPNQDCPPVYQKFHKGEINPACRCLDTSILIEHLKTLLEVDRTTKGPQPQLSKNLLNHLIVAWGVLTDRTFMRLESDDKLALLIGLSSTHYFISGGMSFDQLVRGQTESKISSESLFLVDNEALQHHDAWDDAHDSDKGVDVWDTSFKAESKPGSQAQVNLESIDYHVNKSTQTSAEPGTEQEKYQNYEVQMVNMSPGGYCIEWPEKVPSQLKSGEIIGVKEMHHSNWSIGAIRWVRQDPDSGLQIGVELLSPTALPYGARVLQKKGDSVSEYMRVLLLPDIASIGQPKTLITPMVSFREGQKVLLIQNGHETIIQLTKIISSSGSYNQFEFQESKRISDGKDASRAHKLADFDGGFDSLWNNL